MKARSRLSLAAALVACSVLPVVSSASAQEIKSRTIKLAFANDLPRLASPGAASVIHDIGAMTSGRT